MDCQRDFPAGRFFWDGHRLEDNYPRLLSWIIRYVGAAQGGLYLFKEESDEAVLEMVACYAYSQDQFLKKTFYVGESLVGTCYQQKKEIHLEHIPESYACIQSATGKMPPRNLLLIPIEFHRQVEGVIEIASLDRLKHNEIDFVRKGAQKIAAAIVRDKMDRQIQSLLHKERYASPPWIPEAHINGSATREHLRGQGDISF
ncbi:MAG: GAF domain-containing protein [Bacteroidia bacterium]|nr:GAF domain-containing protein [Bacteroidia bacterium]